MISKNKARFITSLQKKKERDEARLFIIEGDKLVREFISASAPVRLLAAKPEFIMSIPAVQRNKIDEIYSISYEELKQLSTLKTPHNALALIEMQDLVPDYNEIFSGLSLGLDFIQDPGNLGTIIRAAAWFGIKHLICSTDCVDLYNPKVVQASMGALLHVSVYYTRLTGFLEKAREDGVRVYGTMLDGKSIYENQISDKGIILLGNESKGLSEDIVPYITDRIKIPKYGTGKEGIDSLNVSMAASVVLSEFRRRLL